MYSFSSNQNSRIHDQCFCYLFCSDLPPVLEMVQRTGVTIYAVGVGTRLFKDQLVMIAGNHKRVFELENFSSLHQIIPELDFQLNKGMYHGYLIVILQLFCILDIFTSDICRIYRITSLLFCCHDYK